MHYIVTSDIHLGHVRTPTSHIVRSFLDNILSDKHKDVDVIFIAGDLCDRRMQFDSIEAHGVIELMIKLLHHCHTKNISLRVLEGTRSHDWLQSSMLIKLNESLPFKVDIKHVKILDIEYLAKIKKHVLYIPDEWCHSQEELEKQVNDKLSQLNIHQVDIAILHGQFKYQTNGLKTTAFTYDENYFLNLVREYIHIGHYHTHTVFDRIIANGSLERLVHGEEEEKGYVVVKDNTFTFVPNLNSYIYKTIKITPSFTIKKLDKHILSTPPGSYIRIVVPTDHEFSQTFDELKLRYKDHNLKKQSDTKASDNTSVTYIVDDSYLSQCDHFIQSDNLYDALVTSVQRKQVLTEQEKLKFLDYTKVFQNTQEVTETT